MNAKLHDRERSPARRLLRDALQTVFRMFPWPTRPGLRSIGRPDRASPVIVTGNYDLTVRRVERALHGLDAWLVVANSQGINVWCAASGGHLSTHQVVSALKTSGVAERVAHKRAILPQLAATGVVGREVLRRCGWHVRFGPVYAGDLPAYLAKHGRKTDAMRHVRFALGERLEMAVAWGGPAALVLTLVTAPWAPRWALPLDFLALALAATVFVAFDKISGPRRSIVAGVSTTCALAAVAVAGGGTGALVTAAIAPTVLTALLTFDYTGSTPLEGGSHFEERRWHIRLDADRCAGVYNCWEVCPEACFEKLLKIRKVELAHDDRCIRCGACVVQCPTDALAFEDADGNRIEPNVIRRYKLDLRGRRAVDAGEVAEAGAPASRLDMPPQNHL